VVPLALLEKRYWSTDETFTAGVRIANFSAGTLTNARLDWRLVGDAGMVAGQGELYLGDIAVGNDNLFGAIHARLTGVPPACKLTLLVGVAADEGTRVENDWDIWVFAPTVAATAPHSVVVTDNLDDALAHLDAGGTTLLLPDPETIHAPSQIGFSSVFWNTAWTRGQTPHTLGILCDPAHPLFAAFPTEFHSNWQWWELVHGSAAMVLDGFPPALRPLVQPIDTWFEARRLGLLFEARVGAGRLMICSMNLRDDLDRRLVARQMWASLLAYMGSDAFAPAVAIEPAALAALFGG
jgi:hypothetical protein